jgi:hypothetical protein
VQLVRVRWERGASEGKRRRGQRDEAPAALNDARSSAAPCLALTPLSALFLPDLPPELLPALPHACFSHPLPPTKATSARAAPRTRGSIEEGDHSLGLVQRAAPAHQRPRRLHHTTEGSTRVSVKAAGSMGQKVMVKRCRSSA